MNLCGSMKLILLIMILFCTPDGFYNCIITCIRLFISKEGVFLDKSDFKNHVSSTRNLRRPFNSSSFQWKTIISNRFQHMFDKLDQINKLLIYC